MTPLIAAGIGFIAGVLVCLIGLTLFAIREDHLAEQEHTRMNEDLLPSIYRVGRNSR